MDGATPKISVGMPVYNGETYLEEAIQSVLRQTYEHFALFILDNASTDRTEQICRDYASQDKRVFYTRNAENIGAAKNYNRVFQLASSSLYFRWFNADDVCAPEAHQKCIAVLEANPDVVLCCGGTSIIDQTGQVVEQRDDYLDLRQDRPADRFMRFFDVVGLTNAIYGLMRTDAVGKTALMANGSYPAADVNFMAELTLYGKFVEIPTPLFYRRMHRTASSWDRDDAGEQHQFWTANRAQFTLPNWRKNLAYMKAIQNAPLRKAEKLRLQSYILRRMIWIREDLRKELWQEIRHWVGK
jgi:glycosyltransferase involved in cell wall biosynthesis